MTKRYNRTIPIAQEEKAYSPKNREMPTIGSMDAVRKLILERAFDLETNLATLSRTVGMNHAYLQQFINRGVPKTLPETIRKRLASAIDVREDQLKLPSGQDGINHKESREHGAVAVKALGSKIEENTRDAPEIPLSALIGKADLPVFGTAEGGSGALILTNDAADWVARPDPLLKVKDGYGIIVTGDSMSPAFKSGAIALVNPHLPPHSEDICIFRRHKDNGDVLVIIKELRRSTDDLWYVRQLTPRKDFTLKRSEWQICHVTVGNYFRR